MQQDLSATGDAPRGDAVDPGHVTDGAERDDAFWLAHEERRLGQGMSVRQYCHDNGLALSTYRYRYCLAKHRRSSGAMQAETAAAKASSSFIAIDSPTVPSTVSDVEIALWGALRCA